MMSRLRDKMQGDLKLCGFCENTRRTYIRCAARFSQHYGKSPSKLGRAEIRAYLLYLIEEKKLSASTYNVYAAALAFLYRETLERPQEVLWIKRLRVHRNLPTILTRQEVERILAELTLRMRVVVLLAYGAGLRISEICQLQVQDIDSSRMQIHIQHGKGDRQRHALLPKCALVPLRAYWREYKVTGSLLFPGKKPGRTLTRKAVNQALLVAAQRAKVNTRVTPHLFRHGFATHLLEAGADLRTVQVLLGHASIRSTVWYMQVTPAVLRKVKSPADCLRKAVTHRPSAGAAVAKAPQVVAQPGVARHDS
jgi:site-specific recombinase XerD